MEFTLADAFAERSTEQVVRVDAEGRLRISSRSSSGAALRVRHQMGSCFVQSCNFRDGQVKYLIAAASDAVPALSGRLLAEDLAAVTAMAHDPREGSAWLSDARDLGEAAREAALESGAAKAHVRLWRRCRCYAMSSVYGRSIQDTCLIQLDVTARFGRGLGISALADVPAAPLTVARAAEAGRHAAVQAVLLATARPPRSGTTVVVFAPEAAGLLIHEVVGHALEADTAHSAPLWANRTARATSACLTVSDDPYDRWAWEQVSVDEEGTPCVRADLMVDGQVAGVIADRASAADLAITSTGHARRGSYASPPIPRMRHVVARPGADSGDAIVADTARGILVEAIETADAIPGRGSYSLRVRGGREIVNGVSGRYLTGFSVVGGLDEFGLLDAIGNDPAMSVSNCGRQGRWLPVSHSAPTLRFPRLAVRGVSEAS